MSEPTGGESRPAQHENANRARDHLANERTFLAWIRTGMAVIVFGFAIGRFTIALRQWMQLQNRAAPVSGLSAWFGMVAIVAGVVLCLAGLVRYRQTRRQIDSGNFEPAGFIIDSVGILTALFGLGLGGYLVYMELHF